MNYWLVESPYQTLLIVSDGQNLKQLSFVDVNKFQPEAGWCKKLDAVLQQTQHQLCEWFAGERRDFDLPLAPEGTPFQQKVWSQLQNIPYGETRSYGDLAKAINKPSAPRAIGAANGKNPIALIIPCHRVIGANGTLTGYAYGVELKKKLLALEKREKTPQGSPQSV